MSDRRRSTRKRTQSRHTSYGTWNEAPPGNGAEEAATPEESQDDVRPGPRSAEQTHPIPEEAKKDGARDDIPEEEAEQMAVEDMVVERITLYASSPRESSARVVRALRRAYGPVE